MREANLVAPTRRRHTRGDRAHGAGSSGRPTTTPRPSCAGGRRSSTVGGIRVRSARGCGGTHERHNPGALRPRITLGLALRMDRGPGELRWFGIRPSPSSAGEPQCNGIMECWVRTPKGECLSLHHSATLDQARQGDRAFIGRYGHAAAARAARKSDPGGRPPSAPARWRDYAPTCLRDRAHYTLRPSSPGVSRAQLLRRSGACPGSGDPRCEEGSQSASSRFAVRHVRHHP